MQAEEFVGAAGGTLALVALLIASVGYVASIVPLALMLVRVRLWLLRYAQALHRRRRARAQGAADPAIDQAVDGAERRCRDIRYWEQER